MDKEKLKDAIEASAEPVTETVALLMFEGLVGSVAPGMVSAMLSYKQKRQERRLEDLVKEMGRISKELEERLLRLEEERFREMGDKYFPLITDYAIDEPQDGKIEYIVNGYLNIAGYEEIQEDLVLTNYDILAELRLADIAVLRYFLDYWNNSLTEFLESIGLNQEQYSAIKEKLIRMGLLGTKRDKEVEYLYSNITQISKYLEEISKGKKAKLKVKKFSHFNNCFVTRLGKDFAEFFDISSEQ